MDVNETVDTESDQAEVSLEEVTESENQADDNSDDSDTSNT